MLNFDLLTFIELISVFTVSLTITYFSIPSIIYVAKKKRLLETADYRKEDRQLTPYLGGIGIYATIILISSVFNISLRFQQWHCIVAVSLLLFFTGLRHDLVTIKASKRLLIQIMAATVVVLVADVRLHSLMGILGIYVLPYGFSCIISVLIISLLISAFNLMEGMDGLVGSISLLFFMILACVFGYFSQFGQAMACLCIAGAVAGFLRFNTAPAKIFMGNSGSMVIGFFVAVMSLEYLSVCGNHLITEKFSWSMFLQNGILILFAMTIIPVMDTVRILVRSRIKGMPLFQQQKKNISHDLADFGLCPRKIILLLILTTFSFIGLAMLLIKLQVNINFSLLIITLLAATFFSLVELLRKKNLASAQLP